MGADDHKEKTTSMELKVNLECRHCIKEVKEILSKIFEVRDQVYNKKANTITIVVVDPYPEKIRDRLYCKGGKTIKNIEIKEPEKPIVTPQNILNIGIAIKNVNIAIKNVNIAINEENKKPTVIDKPKAEMKKELKGPEKKTLKESEKKTEKKIEKKTEKKPPKESEKKTEKKPPKESEKKIEKKTEKKPPKESEKKIEKKPPKESEKKIEKESEKKTEKKTKMDTPKEVLYWASKRV